MCAMCVCVCVCACMCSGTDFMTDCVFLAGCRE
jgi:hypothetical protein